MPPRNRKQRRSRVPAVVLTAVPAVAFLWLAVWGWQKQAAEDDAYAAHRVTTTAVIGRTFDGAANGRAGDDSDREAIVTFTQAGRTATAQVTLPKCYGECSRDYPAGKRVRITYTAGEPATAVFGQPAPPALLHLNGLVVVLGLLGLVFLVAAVANLVLGV